MSLERLEAREIVRFLNTEVLLRIPTKPNGWSDRRRTPSPSEAEHFVRAKTNSPTGAP
jgi:hypothetical protein